MGQNGPETGSTYFIKSANILNTPKLNKDICTTFLREYDLDAHIRMARQYYSEKPEFLLRAMQDYFPDRLLAATKR